MRRGRNLAIAAVAALAIVGAMASTAGAEVTHSGGIAYVSKVYPSQSGTFRLRANCPKGTHVMSGGAKNFASYDTTFVSHSYPVDRGDADKKPDDGWEVAGTAFSQGIVNWTVYATCTDHKLTYVHRSYKAQPMALTNQLVPCPGNKNIVGGGERARSKIVLNSAFPTSGLWSIYEDSFKSKKGPVTVYAICAGFKTFSHFGETDVPDGQDGGLSQGCGLGQFLAAGGTSNSGGHGDVTVKFNYPDGSSVWAADTNNHSGRSIHVIVYAVCVKHL